MNEISLSIGDIFGLWTVIDTIVTGKFKRYIVYPYKCRCECGFMKILDGRRLKEGLTKGCFPCSRQKVKDQLRTRFQDKEVGMMYGKWTVIEFVGRSKLANCTRPVYKCRCRCGYEAIPKSFAKIKILKTKCPKCDNSNKYKQKSVIPNPCLDLIDYEEAYGNGEICMSGLLKIWNKKQKRKL